MKKLVFMVLFTALSLKMAFAGGVAVGNGGDVIMCSTEVTFKSLDYALTVNNFGNNIEIPSPQSYRESLTRIESLLKLKYSKLSPSLHEFIALYQNHDFLKKYAWRPLRNGVETIIEKPMRIAGPCRTSWGGIQIAQAVIRHPPNSLGRIEFDFDEDILMSLEQHDPLQLSFLLIHEWLWNFFDDASRLRKVNYFFHSSLFEKMSPGEVTLVLESQGLKGVNN